MPAFPPHSRQAEAVSTQNQRRQNRNAEPEKLNNRRSLDADDDAASASLRTEDWLAESDSRAD